MKFGLSDETIEKINGVLSKRPAVEKAVIYGSRAKGNYRNGSDIDLSLFGNITFDELLQISVEVDELMLPYMLDLSKFDEIENQNLKEHIERVGQAFYQHGE